LYELATGTPPFYSDDVVAQYRRILRDRLPNLQDYSLDLLVRGLLQKDPRQRLADATRIKTYDYFKDIDWEMVAAKEIQSPLCWRQTTSSEAEEVL